MLTRKMKEIKSSVKRIYARLVVLTAVVVFGAIAIAQGQKDPAHSANLPTPEPLLGVDSARPIPREEDDLSAGDHPMHDALAADDFASPAERTQVASAEEPLPDEYGETESDASRWSGDVPLPTTQGWGSDAPPDDQVSGDDTYGDYQEYADDGGIQDDYAADVDVPLDDAPPLLPDQMAAAAAPEDASDAASARRNPYRGQASAADAPQYSDEITNPYEQQNTSGDTLPPVASSDLPPLDDSPAEYTASAVADSAYGSSGPDYDTPPATRAQPAYDPATTSSDFADAPGLPPQRQAATGYDEYTSPADPLEASIPATASRIDPQRRSIANDRIIAETAPRDALEGGGRPGPQMLEGPQTPTLTVQKIAPEEIQVGRTATFEIRVRNVGRVAADNVLIRDEVPAGTEYVDSTPKATQASDGSLYWETGTLAPGQEITVAMQLMPVTEGQVGSVATVSFEASASARARVTKPELVLEHTGPVKVLKGEAVRFAIKLSNPGSGAATKVVLQEDVPHGLSHASGAKLEYEVGTIEAGQTRHLELTLRATEPGKVLNTLVATADAGLVAEDEVELEVIAPQLQVAIEGPRRRYLERQATFTVAVANPGTAAAQHVELVAQLPPGLKFVSTNNSGYYDQGRHAVIWSLEQLPAGEMGRAQFTAMPIEMGDYRVKAEARAQMDLVAQQEHPIAVEGIAALLYVLTDKVDPLEVGGQTTYEIKVVNQGSKEATNVTFAAIVPEGMRAVGAKGPTAEAIQDQHILFAPIERLAPKAEAIYHVTVQGVSAGDHRFRVEMTSNEISKPVIKEESTRVYAD